MEDSKIVQKIFDLADYAYPVLKQFPNSEKFTMAADIKRCMDRMLEHAIEANKNYYKKTAVNKLDVDVAKLKFYFRLAHQLEFIPGKKYEQLSIRMVEIGKMVGGWKKAVNK